MSDPNVRRVLGLGNSAWCSRPIRLNVNNSSGALAYYFPKIYKDNAENMDALLNHTPSLERPIPNSVFAAASFNFGPRAISFEHLDFGNKPNGLCPIFCTGDFNPREGGHLVLRQLKIMVEFPPGTLCLIPSATIKHGNASIGPNEHRESFTQYAAGGLFRWVQYGFRLWDDLCKDPILLEREMQRRETCRDEAIAQFSRIDSLLEDRASFLP